MSEYVEDNNNIVYQLFEEFIEFLNCVFYFHLCDDKHIKNMALNSMRLHVRTIAGFFRQAGSSEDDLTYTDIIDTTDNLSLNFSDEMRIFINKSTAHISKKRGSLSFDNKEYFDLIKQVVLAIKDFMDRCSTSLKTMYQHDYQTEEVQMQREFIGKRIVQVAKCLCSPDSEL